ncbi:MAG: hypothetical protein WDW38_002218 [Sanguina aurantia]
MMNRQAVAGRSFQQRSSCPHGLRSQRPQRVVCAAGRLIQLPIFPLNVVALPEATVPLVVFEARYRVLFNTLLAGSPGVEEGLVAPDSPFSGTKKFGMCFIDDQSRLAAIGCLLEIVEFAHIEDGRLITTNKGRERFKITRVVKEKPVLICEVEILEEAEADLITPEVVALGEEVAGLLRTVIRLNVKMSAIAAGEDQLEPEELAGLGPRELSFWVASFFSDIKLLQQNLLEEDSTKARLLMEKTILTETVKYYQAKSALKTAFDTSDSSEIADLLQVAALEKALNSSDAPSAAGAVAETPAAGVDAAVASSEAVAASGEQAEAQAGADELRSTEVQADAPSPSSSSEEEEGSGGDGGGGGGGGDSGSADSP